MPNGKLRISHELLMDKLLLDYKVKDATFDGRTIILTVEHDSIPDGAEVTPHYRTINAELDRVEIIEGEGNGETL